MPPPGWFRRWRSPPAARCAHRPAVGRTPVHRGTMDVERHGERWAGHCRRPGSRIPPIDVANGSECAVNVRFTRSVEEDADMFTGSACSVRLRAAVASVAASMAKQTVSSVYSIRWARSTANPWCFPAPFIVRGMSTSAMKMAADATARHAICSMRPCCQKTSCPDPCWEHTHRVSSVALQTPAATGSMRRSRLPAIPLCSRSHAGAVIARMPMVSASLRSSCRCPAHSPSRRDWRRRHAGCGIR